LAEILDRLSAELPHLSPKLAKAARYAIDHPDRMALDSMRSVASALNVASPTMLRLARHMGFEGYEAFKEQFQNAVVQRQGFAERAGALRHTRDAEGDRTVVSKLFEAALDNVYQSSRELDLKELQAMADLMLKAKTIYTIGSSSVHWLASSLQATGRMILPNLRAPFMGDASIFEALSALSEDDVILAMAFSPYSKGTIDAAKFARSRKAPVLAITDRRSSPLIEHADHYVLAKTDSPHFFPSTVSVLAVIEALLALVVANGDEEMAKRIDMIEHLRQESGAYII